MHTTEHHQVADWAALTPLLRVTVVNARFAHAGKWRLVRLDIAVPASLGPAPALVVAALKIWMVAEQLKFQVAAADRPHAQIILRFERTA